MVPVVGMCLGHLFIPLPGHPLMQQRAIASYHHLVNKPIEVLLGQLQGNSDNSQLFSSPVLFSNSNLFSVWEILGFIPIVVLEGKRKFTALPGHYSLPV